MALFHSLNLLSNINCGPYVSAAQIPNTVLMFSFTAAELLSGSEDLPYCSGSEFFSFTSHK